MHKCECYHAVLYSLACGVLLMGLFWGVLWTDTFAGEVRVGSLCCTDWPAVLSCFSFHGHAVDRHLCL